MLAAYHWGLLCGSCLQVGSFPNWDVWGEWNGRFRDDVRRFVKGDPGCKPAFATRLAGSADLYHNHQRRMRPPQLLSRVLAQGDALACSLVKHASWECSKALACMCACRPDCRSIAVIMHPRITLCMQEADARRELCDCA